MAEVVLLGTASALPSPRQENTYMALVGKQHVVLVDCAGSPYRQLLQAGVEPSRLDTLILTHFHPDHVYGLPALLLALWLIGRRSPFEIYALAETSHPLQAMLALYGLEHWPGMFAVRHHLIQAQPGTPVLTSADFEISATPVQHVIPTIGLRVLNRVSGAVLAYSSDTEPCPGVRSLAQGADLLIHEASGARAGHSSAAQAATIAREVGVDRLVLVHYDAQVTPPEVLEEEARHAFAGPVTVARDLDRFSW
jgi:ribonuclease Z